MHALVVVFGSIHEHIPSVNLQEVSAEFNHVFPFGVASKGVGRPIDSSFECSGRSNVDLILEELLLRRQLIV